MTTKNKFESLVKKSDQKMRGDREIDFKGSDIHHIPKKSGKKDEALKRTKKIQFHLNENEYELFINTLKPGELKADRVRDLVFEDMRKRVKMKAGKES